MLSRVYEFNKSVVKIGDRSLKPFHYGEQAWLVGAIQEEAGELEVADTLVDQVDALVDTVIFALGGLARLGLTEEQAEACFNAVMDANFEKKRGTKESRAVEGVADAIKPEGWVGPEQRIKAILTGSKP